MFTGQHPSVGDDELEGWVDMLGVKEGIWLGEKVVDGAEEVDGSVLGLGVSSRQWKKPVPLCSEERKRFMSVSVLVYHG